MRSNYDYVQAKREKREASAIAAQAELDSRIEELSSDISLSDLRKAINNSNWKDVNHNQLSEIMASDEMDEYLDGVRYDICEMIAKKEMSTPNEQFDEPFEYDEAS